MYLLDTNIISATRRRMLDNASVFEWLATVDNTLIYTNAIVMMELERGILSMERKDKQQGKILRLWFEDTVKPSFAERILPITDKTAQICAKIHIPDHAPENDAWIASTAIEHRLILATRNVADFKKIAVKLFNPFDK